MDEWEFTVRLTSGRVTNLRGVGRLWFDARRNMLLQLGGAEVEIISWTRLGPVVVKTEVRATDAEKPARRNRGGRGNRRRRA